MAAMSGGDGWVLLLGGEARLRGITLYTRHSSGSRGGGFAIWGKMTPNYSAVLDFDYQLPRHGLLPSNNYSQSPTKQLNKSGSTWGVRSIKIFSQVLTALLPADPWGCYQLGQTFTLVWECWANIEGLSWRGIPPPVPALPKLLSNVWTSVEFLIQLKISLFQWTKDDSGVVFPLLMIVSLDSLKTEGITKLICATSLGRTLAELIRTSFVADSITFYWDLPVV